MIVKGICLFCLILMGMLFALNVRLTVPKLKLPQKVMSDTGGKKKAREIKRKLSAMLFISDSKMNVDEYIHLSLFLAVIGVSLGVLINNILLSLVFAIGFPFFQYQMLIKNKNEKMRDHNEKLERYMSVVTNLYMQTEDIEFAILESYKRMDSKEAASRPFGAFLGQAAGNADVKQCILNMKEDVDNPYFHQWCNKLALCNENTLIKNSLPYVVNRMRRKRTLYSQAVTNCYKQYKEFVTVCMISTVFTLGLPQLNPMFKYAATGTFMGKIMTALFIVIILVAIAYVVKINNPTGEKT